MKLYKPKDHNGKQRKNWYITFCSDGIRRRIAISTNKKVAEKIKAAIDGILDCHGSLTPELQIFVNGMNPQLRDKLLSFGVIRKKHLPQTSKHAAKLLSEHIKDFTEALRARTGARYARQTGKALTRIFEQFETIDEIEAHTTYKYLADRKESGTIGQGTFNLQIKLVKQFYRWLIMENRADKSPLEHLKGVTQTEKLTKRRALTIEEQRLLIETTAASKFHSLMTGHDRALVYRLALQTGLRADEIRTLTVSCFDFDARTVTLTGAYTKNKKLAILTLPQALNDDLKAYTANKTPAATAFKLCGHAALMIEQDLTAAGIEYENDQGRADFHSLRHTFITNLYLARVHPADAMVLARHSSIVLTMNYYTHVIRPSLQGIIDAQPDLTATKTKAIG